MSGSGSSVYGLFRTRAEASRASNVQLVRMPISNQLTPHLMNIAMQGKLNPISL